MEHWTAQLDTIATFGPNWFDNGYGRWGVPPDQTAIATARTFIERLGDVPPPVCDADPDDGSVHLQWWRKGESLSVYVEAGFVGLILGATQDTGGFDPDREDVSRDEALAIVRDWLACGGRLVEDNDAH